MKMSSDVSDARHVSQPRQPTEQDLCEVDVVHFGAVKRARAALPKDGEIARIADLLALLANPTRLKILLALRAGARAPHELCVCDLAVVSSASKSMTSHQLRLLRTAGLVSARRAGKLAYYRLADGPTGRLLQEALHVASVSMKR